MTSLIYYLAAAVTGDAVSPRNSLDVCQGDAFLEIMSSPASVEWVSPGHAFMTISLHTGAGPKEDSFGFYPVNGGKNLIIGAGGLENEYKKNPKRFANINWAVKKRITEAQRRAIYGVVASYNSKPYRLVGSNCSNFIHEVVSAAGWNTVGISLLPSTYVRNLYVANISKFSRSDGKGGGVFVQRDSSSIWTWNKVAIFGDDPVPRTVPVKVKQLRFDDDWLYLEEAGPAQMRLPLRGGACERSADGRLWKPRPGFTIAPVFE